MTRFLYALAASAVLCAAAYAAPTSTKDMKPVNLGGINVTCGLETSEADDDASIVDTANGMNMKIIRFAPADGAKMLAAINAHEPVTTMQAERIIAFVGKDDTVLAAVNDGRFCLFKGTMPTGAFEALEDNVFGAGS